MEKDDEKLLSRRFAELQNKAELQNRFTYTDFLGLGELNILHRTFSSFPHVPYTLFGGHEACERKIARFGSADILGYEEPFPISLIKISAAAPKFAEALTHRDYLGSLLGLGIERRVLGDIFLSEGAAYVFCAASIADFLCEELTQVKHTAVTAVPAGEIPESVLPKLTPASVQIASERIDSLLSAILKVSRSKGQELLKSGRVFLDGVLCENSSKTPEPGCVISVRGFGRFIYDGLERTTKKGKLSVRVRKY